jgi:hypothetical protein
MSWDAVAELIYVSTNAWYAARGAGPIFTGRPRRGPPLPRDVQRPLTPGALSWRNTRAPGASWGRASITRGRRTSVWGS